jgi:integrase
VDRFPALETMSNMLLRHAIRDCRCDAEGALKDTVRNLLGAFGDLPLEEMRRLDMQAFLDSLADKEYSLSLIGKCRVYVRAILDEALEQDYVTKNHARLLNVPRVAEGKKPFLSDKEAQMLLAAAEGREHLIAGLFLMCGFRPGELFALRWDDLEDGTLRVDESIWRGKIDTPKTITSAGYVAVPASIGKELESWKERTPDVSSRDFIFQVKADYWLKRHLKPLANSVAAEWLAKNPGQEARVVSLKEINFQMLRRTFATQMARCGTIKDTQAQMRHASPALTLGIYMQTIPESLKQAVEVLDRKLRGVPIAKGSDSVS